MKHYRPFCFSSNLRERLAIFVFPPKIRGGRAVLLGLATGLAIGSAAMAEDTNGKEIALACEGQTFVLINPATKYVKLQIEDSVLEFTDGAYGKVIKSGSMAVVANAFGIPAVQQSVSVGEDLIRFGGRSKDGSYEKQYKLDRQSGLLSEENEPPKHCTVSKRF